MTSPVTMMHQQAAASHYPSAQGGNQHYQGMLGQGNQGNNNIMTQRSVGFYRPSQQGRKGVTFQAFRHISSLPLLILRSGDLA